MGSTVPSGPLGMRPYVAFNPKRPLKPAGPRIEPPPSLPVAMGRRPPATAAAVPPEDPPGVRSGFQGFRVVPCSTVDVQLMPPNSGAVVCAARIAPVARRRVTDVSSCTATRSLKITDASVYGQPSTFSSSFTPKGTPPKGRPTSAEAAASRAWSKSVKLHTFSGDRSSAAMQSSRASSGDTSFARNASTRLQASPNHGVPTGRTVPEPPWGCEGESVGQVASLADGEDVAAADAGPRRRGTHARSEPEHHGRRPAR